MYHVDITADLNDEDETGYVWTFLDEARDPGQIKPGTLVVAGDEDAAAICQVIDLTPQVTARSSTSSSCLASSTTTAPSSTEHSPAKNLA
jgi:hypothetical protein